MNWQSNLLPSGQLSQQSNLLVYDQMSQLNILDTTDIINIENIENNSIITGKKKYKKKSKYVLYCSNCGKNGHTYKNCKDPITSYGIIMINITTNEDNVIENFIDNFKMTTQDTVDDKISHTHITNKHGITCDSMLGMQTFCDYKDNIKFLMIRRKHTVEYIEFIRGRYNVDNIDGIIFLFRQMTPVEVENIGSQTFDKLWDEMWDNKHKPNHQYEYMQSKNKFEKLKSDNDAILGLEFYVTNVKASWNYAEWGFPKGRRNQFETDVDCGIREFKEESGFLDKEFTMLDKIDPIEEIFIGTNGITYKHVYYLAVALSDRDPKLDNDNKLQTNEIGDISWCTYEESINIIRPYHTERKKLLTEIYMYTLNNIITIRENMAI
jgi:8-oxo-dGTP pyrophosphatase MutT (NUDIX family)